ncbi:hypothetical protein LCGC14_3136860 [marine sediment metagenome]|uniref:Uncharacterized protein n=1 Tax=marine sediment metagenome TaxID=412755 RepID=A0A0F8Y517_9ZZZZ
MKVKENTVKQLMSHICQTLDRLDKNEITTNEAAVIAKIHQQANHYLNYAIKRSLLDNNLEVKEQLQILEKL